MQSSNDVYKVIRYERLVFPGRRVEYRLIWATLQNFRTVRSASRAIEARGPEWGVSVVSNFGEARGCYMCEPVKFDPVNGLSKPGEAVRDEQRGAEVVLVGWPEVEPQETKNKKDYCDLNSAIEKYKMYQERTSGLVKVALANLGYPTDRTHLIKGNLCEDIKTAKRIRDEIEIGIGNGFELSFRDWAMALGCEPDILESLFLTFTSRVLRLSGESEKLIASILDKLE